MNRPVNSGPGSGAAPTASTGPPPGSGAGTTASTGPPTPRRPARASLDRWIAAIPLGLGAAYLLFVVAHFRRIITDVHLNPDASWAPVLARDLATDHHRGHILVSTASQYTTIWFLVLTRAFPFRDALWDAVPFLTYLASLGLVVWACWRIAGRVPALLTVALGVGATAATLLTVMSEGLHGTTYALDGALAAFLVYWVTRSRPRRWRDRLIVVALVLAIGATLASDTLFLASGLGPFLGAPLALLAVNRDRRTARTALVTTTMTVTGVVLAVVVNRWMDALGYRKTYLNNGYALVSRTLASRNLAKFARQLRALGNGTSVAHHFGFSQVAHGAMALLLVGAAVVPFGLVAGSLRRRRRLGQLRQEGEPAGSGSGFGELGGVGVDRVDGVDDARFLYLVFWILGGVAVCAAFSLTAFAEGPSDPSRYVLPAFFALAATVPVWAARMGWRRFVVALGVALFCLLSIADRHNLYVYEVFGKTDAVRPQAIAFLENHGVTTGYTGYFDSHSLTLQAGLGVHFYPVIACRKPVSLRLCPLYVNVRTGWFTPRPGTRSFVMYDATNAPAVASVPTPDLGTPVLVRQFGALFVFVYDYDVASKLAPPCPTTAANQLSCPYSSEARAGPS